MKTVLFIEIFKNQERNPCFWVIVGLGIRGFGIRGILLERNPRE